MIDLVDERAERYSPARKPNAKPFVSDALQNASEAIMNLGVRRRKFVVEFGQRARRFIASAADGKHNARIIDRVVHQPGLELCAHNLTPIFLCSRFYILFEIVCRFFCLDKN